MLRRSMTDRQRRAWTPSLGRSSFFFRFSAWSSNNFRFAFLALKVASQGFTWKILICSSKINHVLRCSLSGELSTGRARLRIAVRGAASQLQLQLTEPKEQRVAQHRLCAQAWKSKLKSSPRPAILLDMVSVDWSAAYQEEPELLISQHKFLGLNSKSPPQRTCTDLWVSCQTHVTSVSGRRRIHCKLKK